MADIQVNYSEARKVRVGATPVSLPNIGGTTPPPVEPVIVTIGAGAGLSLDSLNKIQLGDQDLTGNRTVFIDEWADSGVYEIVFTNSTYDIYQSLAQFSSGSQWYLDLKNRVQIAYNEEGNDSEILIKKFYLYGVTLKKQSIEMIKAFDGGNFFVTDEINNKGIEYFSDYEPNFTARSLVTKQYVDGAISGGSSKWTDVDTGNIYRNSSVTIGATNDPTNTLDVVGTARIRTISNLGTAATSVLVPSATGVVSLRTLAELSADMSSVLFTAQTLTSSQKNQARINIGSTSATPQIVTTVGTINDLVITSNNIYFTGAGSVTLTGIQGQLNGEEITILNLTGNDLIFLQDSSLSLGPNRFLFSLTIPNNCFTTLKYDATSTLNRWKSESTVFLKSNVGGTITDLSGSALTLNGLGTTGGATGVFNINSSGGTGRLAMVVNNAGGTSKVFTIFNSGNIDSLGVISHLRSNSSITSTRRDELYLNYAETVATAGTINNLAINASTKLLILTGATDLTGVVPVDNTRLLRIEARSASRIIRHESASSTAANRFSIGADLTINAGEVYQFIYTGSRWRRVL